MMENKLNIKQKLQDLKADNKRIESIVKKQKELLLEDPKLSPKEALEQAKVSLQNKE